MIVLVPVRIVETPQQIDDDDGCISEPSPSGIHQSPAPSMMATTCLGRPGRLIHADIPTSALSRAKGVRGPSRIGCSRRAICAKITQMTADGNAQTPLPSPGEPQPQACAGTRRDALALSLFSMVGSQASVPSDLQAMAPWTAAVAAAEVPAVDPISPFSLEDFDEASGWTELPSGLIYKVVKPGEGDKAKGIFDKVDHFQPFPFVSVRYTAYDPSGKAISSSILSRRDYGYQAGVRQEIQDEDGAVMSMVVGERRQLVVPLELAFKRKLFGQPVPQRDCLLVDVELLGLQPY